MDTRRYLIIAALVAAAFFLSFTALKGKRTLVVAAARPLGAGTEIADGDVTLVPVAKAPKGAFTDPKALIGKRVHVERIPGDIITAGMLGPGPKNTLLEGLPKGWRAIGVDVTRDEARDGRLRPGDTVGVVGVIHVGQQVAAKVVLSGLKVLFVPEEFRYRSQTEQAKSAFSPVTVRQTKEDTVVLGVPAAAKPISFTLSTPVTATVTPTVSTGVTVTAFINSVPTAFGGVNQQAKRAEEGTKPITMTVVSLSPLEVLALLNSEGRIHLFLEGGGAEDGRTPGVTLQTLLPPRREKPRRGGWEGAQ